MTNGGFEYANRAEKTMQVYSKSNESVQPTRRHSARSVFKVSTAEVAKASIAESMMSGLTLLSITMAAFRACI